MKSIARSLFRKHPLIALAIIGALFAVNYLSKQPVMAEKPSADSGTIEKVIDGDTIRLTDGRTVRLLQVDTPEVYGGVECGGREASAYLKNLLPSGTTVNLERDPGLDTTDHYDRELAYVIHNTKNVNIALVRSGMAAPYFYRGERGVHAKTLEQAVSLAQSDKAGMWGSCKVSLDTSRAVDSK